MHDAHFHMSEELFHSFKKNKLIGICNIENEEEYNLVEAYKKEYFFHSSCGIHPWHVDEVDYDSFLPYLEQSEIVGEIGLDNTWCETDLDLQKEVFEKQLQYAQDAQKTVILHLKGMEKEALPYIRKYPNQYIVHWHSCMDYVEEYKEFDCYFTIGPSVGIDDAVTNVVKKVELDHLLMESDGISALEWAFEEKEVDYIACLKRSIQQISKIKGIDEKIVENQLDQNLQRILER